MHKEHVQIQGKEATVWYESIFIFLGEFREWVFAFRHLGRPSNWVRNLPDGRVEMEVQGEPFEVEKMVELLKEAMYIRINKIDSADVPVKEGERKFRTEY